MKKLFFLKFNFSILAISFFSLLVSFFVFVNIVKANFPGGGLTNNWMEINGWAWSPNIGWLSLNCNNDFDGDGDIESNCAIPYGLKIDTSDGPNRTIRAVGGCAWAGNVGWWICFDDPDALDGVGHADAPDWGVYLNDYYDVNPSAPADASLFPNALYHEGLTAGHASILALEEVSGWTNELGFPIDDIFTGGALEGCFNCTEIKTCSDNGNSCNVDGDCTSPATCVAHKTCDNCLQYTYNEAVEPPALTSVVVGYDCSSCTFNGPQQENTICTENAYSRNDNTCTACVKYFYTPGLIADYTTSTNHGYGSMCGWAWNQDSVSDNGVGWIQFAPRITAGNNPYFQVDSGNIYAKGQIKNKNILAPNIYNAFIIETNSNMIYNLYASSTLNLINRPAISFPSLSSTGKYSNTLGSIDYTGLITEVGETGKNKYGSIIDDNALSADWYIIKNGGSINLNNRVFYESNGSFIADASDLLIQANNSDSGSGVVVINNTAILNKNILYSGDDKPINLKNIASVVWIIKGDLEIASNVTEISGTFVVFGQFRAGGGSNQLKVNGSVLAQSFLLNRTYSTGGQPAEKFINDGRLKVNPPLGLQNFSANLPKFTY